MSTVTMTSFTRDRSHMSRFDNDTPYAVTHPCHWLREDSSPIRMSGPNVNLDRNRGERG